MHKCVLWGGGGEATEIAALAITREEIPHEETITCEHKFNQHTMETCQETRQSAEGRIVYQPASIMAHSTFLPSISICPNSDL